MTDRRNKTIHDKEDDLTTEGVAEKVASEAAKAREAVKDKAQQAAEMARTKAREVADTARDTAADRVETAAEAAEAASERLPAGSLEERAMERVASSIRDAAQAISQTRLDAVLGDVERIARRNPVAFAATAAVLGFAVARMVKASERRAHDPDHSGGPDWKRPLPTATSPAAYRGSQLPRRVGQ
ncbi:hypothetical protein LV82_01221 [Albidovulum inexpectatum]|uniref:ElaB/YqjD/DUF883 family membrane-anchored ribosome-binding protein n=1 Tax=Albidovulum inexpectatum TaxID=196587 RepID=A0A2S5JIB0_9RHOB|nr:hypothetical protein [Albidovulum inexpectatum]PPB81179.1 hypothetical protein LV82_01221 [Albidovulum inexpectatum]